VNARRRISIGGRDHRERRPGVGVNFRWTSLLGGFVLVGVGGGFLSPVIADVALSVVPKERSGMAAGINDTFRQVGLAVGVAVWGAIFVGRGASMASDVVARTPLASNGHPRGLVEAMTAGKLDSVLPTLPPSLRHTVSRAAHEGFIAGFDEVMLLGGLLCCVGAALALWLVREHEIERELLAPALSTPTPPAPESRTAGSRSIGLAAHKG
jgi:hypothetical protein